MFSHLERLICHSLIPFLSIDNVPLYGNNIFWFCIHFLTLIWENCSWDFKKNKNNNNKKQTNKQPLSASDCWHLCWTRRDWQVSDSIPLTSTNPNPSFSTLNLQKELMSLRARGWTVPLRPKFCVGRKVAKCLQLCFWGMPDYFIFKSKILVKFIVWKLGGRI